MMNLKTMLFLSVTLVTVAHGVAHAQLPNREPKVITSGPVDLDPDVQRKESHSYRLTKQGDELRTQKRWKEAATLYKEATVDWKNPQAQYGLAQCYLAQGDTAKALESYRLAAYRKTPQGLEVAIIEHQAFEFALLLSQAGQDEEAMFVYNRVAGRINIIDGKPSLKVLLPEFGLKAGQRTYRPQLFQAMAHTAIGITIGERSSAMEHLREAVRLFPGSGIIHFHLAEMLGRTGGKKEEVKAEYERARTLDPKATGKAAEKELELSTMRGIAG